MMRERLHSGSFWGPYLRSVPETYHDPLWWTPDQLAQLQATNLGKASNTNCAVLFVVPLFCPPRRPLVTPLCPSVSSVVSLPPFLYCLVLSDSRSFSFFHVLFWPGLRCLCEMQAVEPRRQKLRYIYNPCVLPYPPDTHRYPTETPPIPTDTHRYPTDTHRYPSDTYGYIVIPLL